MRRSFRVLFIVTQGVGGQILSAKLRRRKHKVRLVSVETAARMRTGGYDFILASTYIEDLGLEAALTRARTLSPNAKIVLGGPGLSSQPQGFLRQYRADFGLIGEADNTIGELFDRFERFGIQPPWREIKGIDGACYRAANNRVYVNSQRPYVSADEIDWSNSYFIVGEKAYVLLQRGCPNHCTFCQKWFGDRVRSAPLRTTISILRKIAECGVSTIDFSCELFPSGKKALALCRAIRANVLHRKLWFTADFTVGTLLTQAGEVNEHLLSALKLANFYHIGLGLESVVEERLSYFNKPHKPSQASRLIIALKEMGFDGHFYTVGRLPAQDDRVVHEIVDVCAGLRISGRDPNWNFVYHTLIVAPGSAIHEHNKDNPSLFVDSETGRKLHPQTNVEGRANRSTSYCYAAPDPVVRLTLHPHRMLWGLEERYSFLTSGDERGRLAQELPLARKVVSRLPKTVAAHALEMEKMLRRDIIRMAINTEGFLERWRQCKGPKAKIIENYFAKLYRGRGQELDDDRLLGVLQNVAKQDPWVVVSQDDLTQALGMFYDNLVSSEDLRQKTALPELRYFWLEEEWQAELLRLLQEVGREAFVERSLGPRPLAYAMKLILRNQIRFIGWSGHLAAIRSHEDSRPILTPLTLAPFNRLMARAARDVTP